MRRSLLRLACVGTLALGACAKRGAGTAHDAAPEAPRLPPEQPTADSVTVGLWHFDERGGIKVTDASPFRVGGIVGQDSRVEFGRFKSARGFTATVQSFVFIPYNPVLESPRGFTVEAWVYLNDISHYELSGIAMRWSPIPNDQSWVLGVVGRKLTGIATTTPSPGWFDDVVTPLDTGHLVFAFRPETAVGTQRFMSTATLPMSRWVHVAASVDGEVVKIYIDGQLDSQAAVATGIRRSEAPLVVGNAIDPRKLSDMSGALRVDESTGVLPWYALNGTVDELRISNVARKVFESTDAR